MTRKSIIFCLIVTIGAVSAAATAQILDSLHYKGNKYDLLCDPLVPYFELFPGKQPSGKLSPSNNWRGYVSTWKIEDQKLLLVDVTTAESYDTQAYVVRRKSVLREVFPGQEKVVAEWFSGLLVIPAGKMVSRAHRGYDYIYEKYLLVRVIGGTVTKEKHFSRKEYDDFRKRQFEAFKKTPDYTDLVEELKEGGDFKDSSFLDAFLFDYNTEYTSKILLEME